MAENQTKDEDSLKAFILTDEEREAIREKIRSLRIIDNIMFQFCAKDNPKFVEHLLRPVVKKVFGEEDDIEIVHVRIEDIIPNAAARGARLDAVALDSKGRYFSVEVQRGETNQLKENLVLRVRFYRGLLDSTLLLPGHEPKELPESNIVFLCEHDPRGDSKSFYESCEVWMDTKEPVNDRQRCVYVNGDYRGRDMLGELNHDLMCPDPEEMHDEILANAVKRFKPGGKDERKMFLEVERMFEKETEERAKKAYGEGRMEGREEGRKEGRMEGRKEGRKEGREEGAFRNLYNMIANAMRTGREDVVIPVIMCGNANHEMEPEKYKELVISIAKKTGYQKISKLSQQAFTL